MALVACWFVGTNTARAATTLYYNTACTGPLCGWNLTSHADWVDYIDWTIGNNGNPEFTFHWSTAGKAACGGTGHSPWPAYAQLYPSYQLQFGEIYYDDDDVAIYDMRYNSTGQTFTDYQFQLTCHTHGGGTSGANYDGGDWNGTVPFSTDTWIHPTPSVYVSPTSNPTVVSSTTAYAVVTLGVGPMEANGSAACGGHTIVEGDRLVPLWIEWEDITRPSSAFASTTDIGTCSSSNTYAYYPACESTSLEWWSKFAVVTPATTTLGNTPVQFTIPSAYWPSGGIGGIRIHMAVLQASSTVAVCDSSWFPTQWPLTASYQNMFDLLGQNTSSSLYTSSTMFASSTFGGDAMQNLLDQLKYRGPGGYFNRLNEAMNKYVFQPIALQGYSVTSSQLQFTAMGKDNTFISADSMNRVVGSDTTHKIRDFSVYPLIAMFLFAIFDFFMWWFQVLADGK